MVGWHHQLNGHEFEQAPGVGDGQGGLACCSPWGRKESDTTELNRRPIVLKFSKVNAKQTNKHKTKTKLSPQDSNRIKDETFSQSVQSLSRVQLFTTPWTAACQASLSITELPEFTQTMSIELVMPSSHLILCHPLLLLPSIFPSVRVFSSESVLHIR